ncbi:response regulator [Flavobacterium sp. SUN046]|uniref:response regulator n=1 Tax=Flavobacterium sp. SUN046 TaxID=3002440 RepID=UPI002DBC988C|nr:response regulator [Flavobacterium sp. SUN046]MEC4048373.1 response regulator [Flavobacterium sp. SUN046]
MENQFRFFLVDDDMFFTSMYHQHITNLNYSDVVYYNNGTDCITNLHKNPDIIFLDHNMDDITGFEVLKKVKRYNPNIYVVMVSAQEDMRIAINALKYGAFDYIVKDNKVCESIENVIQKIIYIKNELKRSNPTVMQKVLSIF